MKDETNLTPQQESENFRELLKSRKKELDMSNGAISAICGVPESTVQKYFSGTPSPSFETVIGIARALDVSVDNHFGITPIHDTPETLNNPENLINRCTSLLVRSNQKLFALYDREMSSKKRMNIFLGAIILFFVILDLMIGSRGWILYDTLTHSHTVSAALDELLHF